MVMRYYLGLAVGHTYIKHTSGEKDGSSMVGCSQTGDVENDPESPDEEA
jgi:hypothetical protein